MNYILSTHLNADMNDSLFNPVHRVIERHAQENPDALAVRYKNQIVTYEHLNKAANRLAHYLQNRQVGFGDHVIVCLEPSSYILVSLLGILKAGAVYVPIDPSFPIARIHTILNQINPVAIISEEHLVSHFGFDDYPLIPLAQLPASLPDYNLSELPLPSQTAYIFHTSGSTGVPKAVMASHNNLSYYMQAANTSYGMNSHTIMPSLARFSFSISLFELLCPLVAGGSVWILDRDKVLDFEYLAKTISQVTMFHAGPSLLKGLIAYIRANYTDFTLFANVQHASSGGDMIPPELLEGLKELFAKAEIFVIYGSTEIACMGCTYLVPRDRKTTKTYVGHPFPNTTVQLLDSHLNPVAQGEEGEVCFIGDGIAQGYLNQPELTEDRFCTVNGQRLYRMGDVGRFNGNNELELLGRVDFQIKIRGMRVELAEVEYQLRCAPGVKDAVVAAKEIGLSCEKTLIAYLVFTDPNIRDLGPIHTHLSQQLPEYMIPACYTFLEKLPLNFNLKLDRNALPDPNHLELHRVSSTPTRLPVTSTQKCLAELWCTLLGTKEVGLDDLFFELGGHSLLGIELLLNIKTTFGVEIDGMVVLREPLEIFAHIIDRQLGQQPQSTTTTSHKIIPSMSVESFYFGPNSSLYGVLYKPQKAINKTVLICGPCPYELELSLFVIQQFARRLAAMGIAVLQFHYFGTGDSVGDGAIESLNRWRDDICSAQSELKMRYPGSLIIGVGIRLGATLLWEAKETVQLEKVILWDPIFDGKHYLEELKKLQDQKIADALYYRNIPKKLSEKTELLGTTYTNNALVELQHYIIQSSDNHFKTITWVTTQAIQSKHYTDQSIQAKNAGWIIQPVANNLTINWYKKVPDTGISMSLANAVRSI